MGRWHRSKWDSLQTDYWSRDRAYAKAVEWAREKWGARQLSHAKDDDERWDSSEHMQLFSKICDMMPYNSYPADVCRAVEEELHAEYMANEKELTEKDIDRVVNDISSELEGMVATLMHDRERHDRRISILARRLDISPLDLTAMVTMTVGVYSLKGVERWKSWDHSGHAKAYAKRLLEREQYLDEWEKRSKKDRKELKKLIKEANALREDALG